MKNEKTTIPSHKLITLNTSTNSTIANPTSFKMTLTRIFTFAITDEAAQDLAVSTFNGFKDTCKKNGASYIIATHAAKVKVLKDTTGGPNWTVYASLTFESEDDANYFAHEDPTNQEVKSKNKDLTAGLLVLQGSFS